MIGIVELLIAIVLTIAFGFLAIRAWRMRSVVLRIIAGLVTTLLTLVLAAVSVVGLLGAYKLYTPHGGPAANLSVQASADQVGRFVGTAPLRSRHQAGRTGRIGR